MALQLQTSIKGITNNWYIKVIGVKAKNKGETIATYGYFYNKDEASEAGNAVMANNISFTAIAGEDIFAQAYQKLKELQEFEDAIDILENKLFNALL